MKKVLIILTFSIILIALPMIIMAQNPPHPNGGSGPTGGNTPVGGGAPIGDGLFLLISIAYLWY